MRRKGPARMRQFADEGRWGKRQLRYRLLGFRVVEQTASAITIWLPWWVRGREAVIAKAITRVSKDATIAGVPVNVEVGHRLLKVTRPDRQAP